MAPPSVSRAAPWLVGNKCTDAMVFLDANENTNGLLRQYFPKGTDLSAFSQAYLNRIAQRLNERPRKTLGFKCPAERLRAVLQ